MTVHRENAYEPLFGGMSPMWPLGADLYAVGVMLWEALSNRSASTRQ